MISSLACFLLCPSGIVLFLPVTVPVTVAVLVLTPMTMALIPAMTVAVTHVTEQTHPEQVDGEAHPTNNHDHLRVLDVLDQEEPLEALHSDGEAESEEEDGVDESSDHLGAGVAVRIPDPLSRRHSIDQHSKCDMERMSDHQHSWVTNLTLM